MDHEVASEFARATGRTISHDSVGCYRRRLGIMLGRDKGTREITPQQRWECQRRYEVERYAKECEAAILTDKALNSRPMFNLARILVDSEAR
jgi:hypothetical protein